jgi:hypothetical protein
MINQIIKQAIISINALSVYFAEYDESPDTLIPDISPEK